MKSNDKTNYHKISHGIRLIIWLMIGVVALFVIGYLGFIAYKLIWLKANRWSFHDNSTVIQVDCQEYAEGLACLDQLDYIEAEKKLKEAYEIMQTATGAFSLETAEVSAKLGEMYLEIGRFEESLDLLNSAYVIFRDQLGEENGKTILAKCQIGVYDIRTDNAERGFAALNDAFNQATYVGDKLMVSRLLARCNTELGNYQKAIEWYRLFDIQSKSFGLSDPVAMELCNDYGDLLVLVGDYESASSLYQNALAHWKTMGEEENLSLSTIYLKQAKVKAFQGNIAEAEQLVLQALELRKRLVGRENIYTAMAYESAASVYAAMGNHELQYDYLREALQVVQNTVGQNHAATAIVWLELGDYYYTEAKYQDSIESYYRALEIRKNILGVQNINTVTIYNHLAEDYLRLGDYEAAEENVQAAMKICQNAHNTDNPHAVGLLCTMAELYTFTDNGQKAKTYADAALDICNRYLTKDNVIYANVLATEAFVNMANGDRNQALEYYRKAQLIYEASKAQENLCMQRLDMVFEDANANTSWLQWMKDWEKDQH